MNLACIHTPIEHTRTTGNGNRPDKARYELVMTAPVEDLDAILAAFSGREMTDE